MRALLIAALLAPLGCGALGDAGSCASVADAIQEEERELGAQSLELLQLRARAARNETEGGPAAPKPEEAGDELGWSYFDDPTCKRPGVTEGQTCVPRQGGGYSNSYVYCSAHRRISPSVTNCESQKGRLSRCVGGGVGLTHNYCDDPFCRNGGAYAGDGQYCDGNKVVICKGDNAPIVQDPCSSQTSWSGNCQLTTHFRCRGGHNQARCVFAYQETTNCGNNNWR